MQSFSAARVQAGLTAEDVQDLLGEPLELIYRWEQDEIPAPARVVQTLRGLALCRATDRDCASNGESGNDFRSDSVIKTFDALGHSSRNDATISRATAQGCVATVKDYNARAFPRTVSAKAPPIKSQGIKTKLVSFIFKSIAWDGTGLWIEPFLGTGAVAFNAAPRRALVADTNKHLIDFYVAVQSGEITPRSARLYLESEGARLQEKGESHFYEIRGRFNSDGDPMDFLFLNRACFNGMIRFSRKGKFNVPFCRKPDRFRPAYITKIVHQIEWLSHVIRSGDWTFLNSDWRPILDSANQNDFVYLDPPYVGRHTDYYDSWNEQKADDLARSLRALPCGFAYSMWARNRYRENEHLTKWFSDYPVLIEQHFYHVGPTESLRNPMEEALVVSHKHVVREPLGLTATRQISGQLGFL